MLHGVLRAERQTTGIEKLNVRTSIPGPVRCRRARAAAARGLVHAPRSGPRIGPANAVADLAAERVSARRASRAVDVLAAGGGVALDGARLGGAVLVDGLAGRRAIEVRAAEPGHMLHLRAGA